MIIEDIINIFSSYIVELRKERSISGKSSIILQRYTEINPKFRAYKTYKATIWLSKPKEKCRLDTIEYTAKVSLDNEEKQSEIFNGMVLLALFKLSNSKSFDNILNDSYGNTNE